MVALALLAILADGVLTVPPSQWRALDIPIPQHSSTVSGSFRVLEGSKVQAILLDRAEAERFHRGRSIRPLHATGFDDSGRFRVDVREAGSYVLIIDNRLNGQQSAAVELRLEVLNATNAEVRTLPPERRRQVVALSLAFFGAMVLFSARQYLKHQS